MRSSIPPPPCTLAATGMAIVEHPIYGRLYKSGDLARCLSDGTLIFIERADFQVQKRAYHRLALRVVRCGLRPVDMQI